MKKLSQLKHKTITRAKTAAQHVKRLPSNPHRSFKRTPPSRQSMQQSVRATWRLVLESFAFIRAKRNILVGLATLYAVLAYVIIGGVSQIDYVAFKDASQNIFSGSLDRLTTALSLFGAAISGSLVAPATELQQFMAGMLVLLFWLVFIWTIRMLIAKQPIKLRDALYNGPTPIFGTITILLIIMVQLIPASLGVFAYVTAQEGGWLYGGVEAMVYAVAALLLCVLSLYWMVTSIIALIIVTLPGTYPLAAIDTAREIVFGRKWSIWLRIIGMLITMLVLWALVLVPIFLIDNWLRFDWLPLVPISVQLLSAFSLLFTSVYTYKLYRYLL